MEPLRGDPSCCEGCAAACPATCVCAMAGGEVDELKTLTSLQEYLVEDTGSSVFAVANLSMQKEQ